MSYDPYSAPKNDAGKFNKAFDYKGEKIPFLKYKKDTDASLYFIPYNIGSKLHPAVFQKKAEIGDSAVRFDYWVHKSIGPQKVTVMCPNKMAGKPCPICEEAERIGAEKGWKDPAFAALKAKERTMFNVVEVSDDKEEVKVFDETAYYFTKLLWDYAEAQGRKKHDTIVKFADPEKHIAVEFSVKMEKFNGFDTAKYTAFSFDREATGVDERTLEKAFCLDSYGKILSYEDLTNLLYGNSEDEEEEDIVDERPKKTERATRREAEEDDEPAPSRKRPKEEDDEPPVVVGKKRPSNFKEDDDDAPEDDKPKGPTCPFGRVYGEEYSHEARVCGDCDLWDGCRKATKKRKADIANM